MVGDLLPELSGVPARVLGRRQRHVGRPVTVIAVGRSLQPDGVGQRIDGKRHQGIPERSGEKVGDHR